MKRLGYYTSQFPFQQGRSAGPYAMFLQPPNASLMRVRVACVAVGQQIGQPVKPNLKIQRARRRGCACRHRGLGQSTDYIPMDPETAPYVDMNTGTYNSPVTGPQVAAGTPDVTDLPLAPSIGPSLEPLQPADSSGQPESPPGTQLVYTVSWAYGNILSAAYHATTGSDAAIAAFSQQLQGSGMSVVSSQVNNAVFQTGYSVSFLIADSVGHAYLSDVQGVCDSIMRGIVGNNLTGSNVQLSSGLPFSLGSFFNQNWPWLAGISVAAVLAYKVL